MEIAEAMGPYASKQFTVGDHIETLTWGAFCIPDTKALFRLDDFRAFFYREFNGCWDSFRRKYGGWFDFRPEADPLVFLKQVDPDELPISFKHNDHMGPLNFCVRTSHLECAKQSLHAMHPSIQDQAWSKMQTWEAWKELRRESGWTISKYASGHAFESHRVRVTEEGECVRAAIWS